MITLWSIFSIATFKNWKLWKLDVKNGFLYGELDNEVFMEHPKGYVLKQYPHHVYQLRKELYSLTQAPLAWYGKVAQYFIFHGFKVSKVVSYLSTKLELNVHLLVLLYVDDMIITGDNEAEISNVLKDELVVHFEMKNMGEVGYFLGLEVERSYQWYFISQKGYAKKLVRHFGIGESKEKATLMEPYLKLIKDNGKHLKDERKFGQLVGSLIYLTITRLELAYFVDVISQFMQNLRTFSFRWCQEYSTLCKGSIDHGPLYIKGDHFLLKGYPDADWECNADDHWSTSSYYFSIGSTTISWCSKKQSTVAFWALKPNI